MLIFNLKIAVRNLWKHKTFTAINIFGLAISMACCILIALYVFSELGYDGFHKNMSQIYRITEKQNQAGDIYNVAVTPGPLTQRLTADYPFIEAAARINKWSGTFSGNNRKFEESSVLLTENSFFQIFDFPLIIGNRKTALDSKNQIIITESTAEKYFGSEWRTQPDILDKIFVYEEQSFQLTGIAKDLPINSSIQFDILLPISYLFSSDKFSNQWNSNNFHSYLKLSRKTNVTAFQNSIRNKLKDYNSDTSDLLLLQPLGKQYLSSKFDFNTDWGKRSNILYVQIFSGVGLLLLVMSCVNFVNLSTARSLKRSMEVGIRKINGASRKQLIWQFLFESWLLSGLSGTLSIVFIKILQPGIHKFTGNDFAVNISGFPVFLFLLAFIILIGFLAGLYPAVVLSSFKPLKVLKGNNSIPGVNYLWRGLVVFQFSICMVLMVSGSIMYRQLQFIQNKNLGFDKNNLITVKLRGKVAAKPGIFKDELKKSNFIISAAPATVSLVNVDNSSYFEWDGMKTDQKLLITNANVDPDFISTLRLTLISGENFSPQKSNDTANYIVNEAAAKAMNYTAGSIVGKGVNFWGAKGKIIGVVRDFHFKSLNTNIGPFIFRYQPQDRYFSMFVRSAPGKIGESISALQSIYKSFEKEAPMEFEFVNEALDNLYREDRKIANFILIFTCLTIFVGCLGLFGLTLMAAELRVKEVGIRKILGASVLSITGLLSGEFLKLVIVAAIIAVPVAWYAVHLWLQDFAYRIVPEFWVFVLGTSLVIGLAMASIGLQAIRAARANPARSLRAE